MARVEERVHIHRPPEHVWSILTDWEGQSAWMVDARSVTVTSAHRSGVGVTITVPTDIAFGVVVRDEMTVTEWQEERRIAVAHTSRVISGHGAFELAPTHRPGGEVGTIFTWSEEFAAPFGRPGELVARALVAPYVAATFRRSLQVLKRLAESQAVRP